MGFFTSEPPGGPNRPSDDCKDDSLQIPGGGGTPRQEGWVWAPLALTRERETVAKAFTVISMGVCTLIKKKKKNHVFYRQNDFI